MPETNLALNNASAISVSELSSALRRTLEDRFGYVRVRGEISGYRGPHSTGHAYFTLKDEGARLDAVIWRSAFLKMRVKPEEGLEIVAAGKLTTFPGKSTYQIVIDSIEPAGVGALMALLEARRRQLSGEGLFDNAWKRSLPFLPATIGIVTSPSGAVIRDILHRLADRFPVHVIVWPVRVQGESAAEEIAAAISGFGALGEALNIPRPDVLIVARGGGALEDLWSFNEEVVVRAAFGCPIPLVSAVGHETDWTLIDHVADLRAPTPTAAAELCVPVRSQLVARVSAAEARLADAWSRLQQRGQAEVRSLARGLPAAAAIVSGPRQRLDSATDGLSSTLRSRLGARLLAVAVLARRLARFSPRVQLSRASERLRIAEARMAGFSNTRLSQTRLVLSRVQVDLGRAIISAADRRRDRLGRQTDRWASYRASASRTAAERSSEVAWLSGRLALQARAAFEGKRRGFAGAMMLFGAMNHTAVLSRGYALIRDNFGTPLSSAKDIRASQRLRIQFADGEIAAKAAGARSPKNRKTIPALVEQRVLL